MDEQNGVVDLLESGGSVDSNAIINPDILRHVDNARFERVGFCARVSSAGLRGHELEPSIGNLKRIWSEIVLHPTLQPPTVDIGLESTSRNFAGLNSDVRDLKRLFWMPNSALVVAGFDGLTTDIHGFLHFLNSEQHKHNVDIFSLKDGDLWLHTTSEELQLALHEWVQQMPERSQNSLSTPSSLSTSHDSSPLSSTSAPGNPLSNGLANLELLDTVRISATEEDTPKLDLSPLEELIGDWEIASWAIKLIEIESQISLALDPRSRNGPSPYGNLSNAQALLQIPQSLTGERIHVFREIAYESTSSSRQTLDPESQTPFSLAPPAPSTTMP